MPNHWQSLHKISSWTQMKRISHWVTYPGKGARLSIMQKTGADTWAATFLQRCAKGYKYDPAIAKLIKNQQAKPEGPDKWTYHRGLWFSKGALVIPNHDSLRTDCISQHHDPPHRGHQGILRTRKAIERFYWWPAVGADVERYIQTCESCQR